MAVTLKSSANTQTLLPLIRQQVAALDKDLPIYHAQPMTDYVDRPAGKPVRDLAAGSWGNRAVACVA